MTKSWKRKSWCSSDDKVLEEKVLVFFKTNEPGKALEALSGYAIKHPGEVELLVLQARAHIVLKNYVEADRILKLALAKNPLYAPAYLYLGVVRSRNQQLDQALENLNRAIELDSSLLEAYKERARTFMDIGEPVRAALDLTAAAELDPSDGEILAMRGLTLMNRSLYDAAIADFTSALESLFGDPRILYDRAAAYLMEDEQNLALADLDAVLRVRPDAARALSLRGVARFNLGQVTQAREDFQKAAAANPNDALVWNNSGFFHYKMKEYAAAIDCYSRSLRLNPGYKEAQYNLSLAVQKKNASELPTVGLKPPHD
jgi:Tfp pilus assembly protein PilF